MYIVYTELGTTWVRTGKEDVRVPGSAASVEARPELESSSSSHMTTQSIIEKVLSNFKRCDIHFRRMV